MKHSKVPWGIWAVLAGLIYLFLIGYIDFRVISPRLLPKDYCYYHTHPIPAWVDWLYMNGASNGHPDGSFTHLMLLLILSIFLGVKTGKFLTRRKGIIA